MQKIILDSKAFYHDRDVFIMDGFTIILDNQAEYELANEIKRFKEEKHGCRCLTG